MRCKPLFLAATALAATLSMSAQAQMPVSLLDAGPSPDQARAQLESLLACRPGTAIDPRTVEGAFASLGLGRGLDGFYFAPRGKRVVAFDAEVVAGLVSTGVGERKVALYLRGPAAAALAKRLGVVEVDEQANTDDPSYFKRTGKRTTLLVGAAAEQHIGQGVLKYQATVACQVN